MLFRTKDSQLTNKPVIKIKDLLLIESKDKIPLKSNGEPVEIEYSSCFENSLECTGMLKTPGDHTIIAVDIDDLKTRSLLSEIHLNDTFQKQKWVYSYNVINNSFHFYFQVPNDKLRKILKNKKTYLAANGLVYEIITDKIVVFNHNYNYYNFDKPIPTLPTMLYPVIEYKLTGDNERLVPLKNIQEIIESCDGNVQSDKRSLKLLQISKALMNGYYNHQISNEEVKHIESELYQLYEWYNSFIFKEPLDKNNVKWNINQVIEETFVGLNSRSTNTNTLLENSWEDIVHLDGKKVKLRSKRFIEWIIEKHKIFQHNGVVLGMYKCNYYDLEERGLDVPNVLYKIIEDAYEEINKQIFKKNNYQTAFKDLLELKIDKYNEYKKMIFYKSSILSSKDLINIKRTIVVNNVYIKLWSSDQMIALDKKHIDPNLKFYDVLPKANIPTPFFNNFNINYDPNVVRNSKIESFLHEIFWREDTDSIQQEIDLFWEMLGTCFLHNNNIRKSFIIYGYGKNGKSSLLNFMKTLLGVNNTSTLSLEQINEQFMLNNLINKTANFDEEMGAYLDADTHIYKSIISGGGITVDVKHSKPKQLENVATMIHASNQQLKVKRYHSAVSDRIHIIRLKNKFDNVVSFEKKMIEDTLLTKDEDYSYCFNKVLEALNRLMLRNWQLTISQSSVKEIRNFIMYNSSIHKFLINQHICSFRENSTELQLTEKGVEYFKYNDIKQTYSDYINYFGENEDNSHGSKFLVNIERLKHGLNEFLNIDLD